MPTPDIPLGPIAQQPGRPHPTIVVVNVALYCSVVYVQFIVVTLWAEVRVSVGVEG